MQPGAPLFVCFLGQFSPEKQMKNRQLALHELYRNYMQNLFSAERKITFIYPVHRWEIPLAVYTGDGDDQPRWS